MIETHPPFNSKFVVMDDVIAKFKDAGVLDEVEALRRAQKIWDHRCFSLDIYSTGDKEGTKAEFMQEWLNHGYTWPECMAHLGTLFYKEGKKREPPETFKTDAKKRLRENIANTYAPREETIRALDDGRAG